MLFADRTVGATAADDLALLVLTAGVALAFAITRRLDPIEATCFLVLALPAMVAFAWLGRYFLEELVLGFRRRTNRREQTADLSFLDQPGRPAVAECEVVEAEVVELPTDRSPSI
jgi:hypothetical protein